MSIQKDEYSCERNKPICQMTIATFNCNFIRILNPKETFSRFISFALNPHCSRSLASIIMISSSSTKTEKQWQVSPYHRLHFIFAFVCRLCVSASFFWPSWPEEGFVCAVCRHRILEKLHFISIEFMNEMMRCSHHTFALHENIRFYLAIGHMLVLWVPGHVDLFYAFSLNQ